MDARWGFPWVENYGMTEAGLIARVPLELADELRGSGSTGPPLPEVDVRIVDNAGNEVSQGEVGEILVRQPGQFRGYYGLPKATAEIMRDGFVATGDLGVFDARGYLSVVGRKKDVIRRSGENISPAEVESVLTSHPQVLEAAVIGVPDVERGEEVKAFVRLVDGASEADVSEEQLIGFCKERLAQHKVPRYIEYVSEFSHTPSMRVRKERLRAQAATVEDENGSP
jgi:crotonobetaine/carnitine-CoA ligase